MGSNVVAGLALWIRTKGRRAIGGAIVSGILALSSAAPATAQYNELTLEWTAPGDDGNVGRATSYDLRYRTTAVSGTDTLTWWNSATQVSGEPAPGNAGATDQMLVSGLAQGTTYYFIIRALDEVANISGFSNVAVGTTQSCPAPTSFPSSFDAVADTGQVLVTWGGSDPLAVSLRLYRATGSGPFGPPYQTLPTSATSFLDTNVTPGTTYRYRATWMGAVCEGQPTATETVLLPGTPPPTPPPSGTASPSIRVMPNPAVNSIRLVINITAATAQSVTVRVYDMNGRLIADLADGTYPPGSSEVVWGRTGRSGERVAPGYYEVLGNVGSERVRDRLILLP